MAAYKNMYMHLLDGKPANYHAEGYIYFVGATRAVELVGDLKTLRKQQKSDKDSDSYCPDYQYDYVRVKVPA